MNAPRTIATDIPDDPPSLDPQRATDMCSTRILNNALEGLVRVDPAGRLVPAAASGWAVDRGGTRYAFSLRRSCWSDGSAVTARDFAYSWERALRPDVESPYAALLRGIEVEAEGDDLLRVHLARPNPWFLRLTSFSTFLPVKRGLPEALGAGFARTEGATLFNGPFRIARWEPGRCLVMTPNPGYHAREELQLDEIRWIVVKEAGALMEQYRRGDLDIVYRVPTHYLTEGFDLERDLQIGPDCLTEYLVFNTRRPPLGDAGVRRALGRSVGRARLLDAAVRVGFRPAYGLVHPALAGGVRERNGDCFAEDGGGAPRIGRGLTLVGENTTQGIGHLRQIAEGWRDRFGAEVTVVPLPLGERIRRVQAGDFDVAMVHWRADYDDPLTFLELYRGDSPWNEAGWRSAEYDRLLDRAAAPDAAGRTAALAAAERLLIDEMPVAPLYYQVRPSLVRPGLSGIASAGVGSDQGFRWARVG